MRKFWKRCDLIPPILVRLLARRRHGPPLTEVEIAKASGLDPYHVYSISNNLDWRGIDLPTMRAFTVACGVDFDNRIQMKRVESYLKSKPTWQYLRKSPDWIVYYQPLLRKLYNSAKK